jgi:glycosyltransferase involved in cell wall biosynthesis
MGAVAARNKALELAQGTYIQWLDADDLLHPGKIAAQMAAVARISDRRVLLSGSFGSFYYRTERAQFVETSLWRDLKPLDYFLVRFNDNTCFQTDVWLVSRELTNAAGPWTDWDSPDDDGEYFCRVVMQSTGVTFVRDARSYYRIGNPGSLANRRSHKATVALFASKEKCIRYLLALEDSPRTRTACIQLLQDWIFHLCEYEDVVAQSNKLAAELGGTLERRPLEWKYKLIEWLCGYDASLRARHALRSIKAQAEARVDRLLYNLSAVPAEETEATRPHPPKGNSMRFIT